MANFVIKVETVSVPNAAAAYDANDVVGGLLTIPLNGKNGGFVSAVALVDSDNVGAAFDLYLFSSAPHTIADGAAFAPTVADLLLQRGTQTRISSYGTSVNSLKRADVKVDPAIGFDTGNHTLYGYLPCVATPTFAHASALTLLLELCYYE